MALIQFTRNYTDHSTDRGYQFEFFCDRCGNGFISEFQASTMGMAGSAVRAVSDLFGGFLGGVGSSTYEIERAVGGPAHDKAYRGAVSTAKPNFKQCPKCAHWVCQSTCWNAKRMLCYDCAPDVEAELASAQYTRPLTRSDKNYRSRILPNPSLDTAGKFNRGIIT